MTTPLLPPPPPAAGHCSRHFNPCPQCQREYGEALWLARHKKYQGPELAFWGGFAALVNTPLAAVLLACYFLLDNPGPLLELRGLEIGPFSLVFGSFLAVCALFGIGLLAEGLRLWKKHPIDWDNPP